MSRPSSDLLDRLPDELHSTIEAGIQALRDSQTSELPLPIRKRLYALLGPELRDENDLPRGPGYRRRVLLDMLTAQRVLPVWERTNPDDRRAHRMLLLANGVVRGTVDRASAERERHNFFVDVGDESSIEDPGSGWAGITAAKVVGTALYDRQSSSFAGATSDADLDEYAWPTEFLASQAATYATSADEDVERRRAFWKWFLTEAVPAAYFADSVTADQG